MTRALQRTSSGIWEADRLLQEEEEEYLDVSTPARSMLRDDMETIYCI